MSGITRLIGVVIHCEEHKSGDTRVCQVSVATRAAENTDVEPDETHPVSVGETVSVVSENTKGQLEVSYTTLGGTVDCTNVTTVVTFVCNRDGEGVVKMEGESECRHSFTYTGRAGCRQCQGSDFKPVISECDAATSTRNITFVAKEDQGDKCVGGVPETRTEHCEPYQATLADSIRKFKHKFAWQDEDSEDDDQQALYTRYETPGKLLAGKLSRLNSKFGLSRVRKDIMDPTNIGI
eukprot:sb/3469206/